MKVLLRQAQHIQAHKQLPRRRKGTADLHLYLVNVNPVNLSLEVSQTEVLGWLAKGLTNREIDNLMGISEDGVKAHLKIIFQKLHAADRTEAVAVAMQRGYLREE